MLNLLKSFKFRDIVKGKGGLCMNVLGNLKKRRSVRKYQTTPVEGEKITEILDAARLGPSANNQQPCYFIVVTKPEVRESLRAAYNRDWFIHAPTIIVGCANPKEAWRRSDGEEYWKVDLAIAMQNLVLSATEHGLGTCWIAALDEKAVKKALNIPKEIRVVAMTPLGYPDEDKGPVTERKSLEQIVHYDKW
jgi:nitroreductase